MGGGGGGYGEYNGECLFDNDRNNNKYNDNDKYNNAEDGKGLLGGADNGGNPTRTSTTLSAGRTSAAWP
jgi:hypothetical protein